MLPSDCLASFSLSCFLPKLQPFYTHARTLIFYIATHKCGSYLAMNYPPCLPSFLPNSQPSPRTANLSKGIESYKIYISLKIGYWYFTNALQWVSSGINNQCHQRFYNWHDKYPKVGIIGHLLGPMFNDFADSSHSILTQLWSYFILGLMA